MEIEAPQNNNQRDYEESNKKLQQFSEIVQEEIKFIDEGEKYKIKPEDEEYKQLKNQLISSVLTDIAQTGEEKKYEWKYLRSFLIIIMRNVLTEMQNTYPDVKTTAGESFEDELEVILQFLCSFEQNPPFTLQRICEILLDPKKNYKSSKKILFAIEKLVNVSPIEKSTLVF